MMRRCLILCCLGVLSFVCEGQAQTLVDEKFYHIRNAEPREWSHFPEKAERQSLEIQFDVETPEVFRVLTLRQKGTKQTWSVSLNGKGIGSLQRDHNHLEHGLQIPPGLLKKAGNALLVASSSDKPDDIEVGDIKLWENQFPVDDEKSAALQKARGFKRVVPKLTGEISLNCLDKDTGQPVPCRYTVVDKDTGALAFIGIESDDRIAAREGVIYTIDGQATFEVDRAKRYSVYCGRGFEYSLASAEFSNVQNVSMEFQIQREVKTPGLVACDTHLHTYEMDRHGDCTVVERILSAAGEGVELPVSTGHDKHVDYALEAKRIGADRWLTPVVGCEVTTSLGHFNSFPIEGNPAPAEHKLREWDQVFKNIYGTPGVRVCILNHGRDVHRNFTPLAPENFDSKNGMFLQGRKLLANGMEIINSGATQTDPMQLVGDWFALLKSGHKISAVGSSDSHTVNFAIPGQGRTYLEVPDDSKAGAIDVAASVDSFVKGKTWVSFGLLTLLDLDDKEAVAKVRVLGPSWTTARRVQIFRNGELVKDLPVNEADGKKAGEKFSANFAISELKVEKGDFLCAVATGPGISGAWWPMMPPYQPDTPDLEPYVFGMSPAVWVK